MNIEPIVSEWHFLLVSERECVSGQKLRSLMARFDQAGLNYCAWLVPCAENHPYKIEHDVPQVKGAFVLEYVSFDDDL